MLELFWRLRLRYCVTFLFSHYYGRDGESIGPLSIYEIEQIGRQDRQYDWSAEICENATINDLEADAILTARREYKNI